MSSPSLVWVTEDGNLAIGDMPNVGGYRGRRAPLQPKNTLSLALSESVLEVQTLNPQPSSPLPPPCPECAQTHIVPGAVHVCFWTMHPHPHPPPPPPGAFITRPTQPALLLSACVLEMLSTPSSRSDPQTCKYSELTQALDGKGNTV